MSYGVASLLPELLGSLSYHRPIVVVYLSFEMHAV